MYSVAFFDWLNRNANAKLFVTPFRRNGETITMLSRHEELAGFAHNPDTQVHFSGRADRFLEQIKEAPIRRLDAKPMRKTVRAAVKELNRLQHEYREMYAVHLMPYYEELVDALANHACEMLAFIERSEVGAETKA